MQNLGKKNKKISDEMKFAADFFFPQCLSNKASKFQQWNASAELFVVLVHSGNMRELETVAGDGRWRFRQTTG